MIYSSKIDFKPFAAVWRKYEDSVTGLKAPVWREHYSRGAWNHHLDYGDRDRPEEVIRVEVVQPEDLKPGMKPNPYDDDGVVRVSRSQELDAMDKVIDAADEWADLLLPLESIPSESIPKCFYGSGLRDIRSCVYSSVSNEEGKEAISIAWTNESAAPVELLRLASRRWSILDDDAKILVVRAIAGWLSTKVKLRYDKERITDADFVTNVCLALGNSSLFPPAVTEWQPTEPKRNLRFTSNMAHTLSQTHASFFREWCKDFFEKGVREPENELRRGQSQAKNQTNYGLRDAMQSSLDIDQRKTFVSNIDPLALFETHEEVKALTSGLSSEEKALVELKAEGYSLSEIARLMRVHKSTVSSRLFRIRTKPHVSLIRKTHYMN